MSETGHNGTNVAVIVTTYNRPAALSWVLASLAKQTVPPSQIVIADDGSTSDTLHLIKKWVDYFDRLRPTTLVTHVWQEDLGFRAAAVRNLAVKSVTRSRKNTVLIFLDGDCVVPSFFVQNHLALLASRTMVAGGRGLLSQAYTADLEDLSSNTSPDELVSQLERFTSSYRLWRIGACDRFLPMQSFAHSALNQLRDFRPKNDGAVRTCNLSLFSDDFDRVGGFDESFVGWGSKILEFAVRLISSGVRVRSGRFATNAFHLWHPERSRSQIEMNAERLKLTRQAAVSAIRD